MKNEGEKHEYNIFRQLEKIQAEKNLTQEQVAEILSVNVQTVSRWECNTTSPDIAMLPQIAKLYCVTIDDLFKKTEAVYDNYAQRLSAVYETTRRPEDFISADFEFKKMMNAGSCSAEDFRCYGILHHFMMRYCIDKAVNLFDRVLAQGEEAGEVTY
ncbi:MAG: helix-turn-helix transcriptional regulator [Oscillospiraceae bacterium]|nr:helix-turn-helix transcriptional regulator [Oscillospiraceae bacterium]